MIYVGLDMSINSPGLTIFDGDKIEFHFRYDLPKRKKIEIPDNFYPHPTGDKSREQMDRYLDNANWIKSCINGRPGRVVLEGYALASVSSSFAQIIENIMTTKLMMHNEGLEFITPSPNSIKKFATGSGNAGKGLVIHKFEEDTGIDLYKVFQRGTSSSPLSDIADSYFMAKWARDNWPNLK